MCCLFVFIPFFFFVILRPLGGYSRKSVAPQYLILKNCDNFSESSKCGGKHSRGATMIGAELETFQNLESLDRRKWPF